MSSPLVRHGREIVFQPQLFARQYEQLKAEIKRLKQELDQQSFLQHPQVKPLAFALTGPLRRYRRLKGLGLPDRYRLFFRVFQQMVRRGDLPQDWDKLQDELNRP